jgi:hypothetical protein
MMAVPSIAMVNNTDSLPRTTALQPRLQNGNDNTTETYQEPELRDNDNDDDNDDTASSSSLSQAVGNRFYNNNNNNSNDDDFSDEMLRNNYGRALEPWDWNIMANTTTLDELSSFLLVQEIHDNDDDHHHHHDNNMDSSSSSSSSSSCWEVSHAPSTTVMMVGAMMVGRGA